jgi:hypothetical protein
MLTGGHIPTQPCLERRCPRTNILSANEATTSAFGTPLFAYCSLLKRQASESGSPRISIARIAQRKAARLLQRSAHEHDWVDADNSYDNS